MKSTGILLVLSAFLFSCSSNKTVSDATSQIETVKDPHTFSNIAEVHTEHIALDLEVNFSNKTIYGIATHTISKHDVKEMIFDIKDIEVLKVTLDAGHKETEFKIGESDKLMGQPLKVVIEPETKKVNIHYQTTEGSVALDWLPAELTSGKKHPFVYTQGQAILTRSWIPCQDSPLNRITYSAKVKVPSDLLAVMSANQLDQKNDSGVYHFEMKQRIPSYLIALAVGDLEYHKLGDKCGVFAEPELINECASEFEDLPEMIRIAESIYGKYQWEQYDVIMLPYSFPFGGMENPRLTFANPTLLAGDKSLVSVIAHELAHSWSGNLVTNATWDDFWLNEGFTVYFENRIMEKLEGKEVSDILAIIEFQDLEASLKDIEESEHPEDSNLKLHLERRDPDDGMTDVAYVKGAYFLRTLEKEVGRAKFDEFLNKYFQKFSFQTLTTEQFIDYLNKELLEPNDIEFNTNEWIYEPGLPENCIRFKSDRLDRMSEWAKMLNKGKMISDKDLKNLERTDLTTQEWQTLIRNLNDDVPVKSLIELDRRFEFSTFGNNAIKSDWFKRAARSGYREVRPQIREYLIKIGRRWFVEGIYSELMASEDQSDHAFAREVFEEAKKGYHFITANTISEIVKK